MTADTSLANGGAAAGQQRRERHRAHRLPCGVQDLRDRRIGRPAGARPHRFRAQGRRDRRDIGQVGLGQVDVPARAGGVDASERGLCHISRQSRRQPGSGHRHGVPDLRALSLAHRAGQRRIGTRSPGHRARGAPEARRRRDRPDRPRRFRIGISQGALGRHAPARGIRPRAGGQSRRAAAGRALFRARRADRRDAARRHDGSVARQAHTDQGHDHRLAQHRGSGGGFRPHHHLRQRSRAASATRFRSRCRARAASRTRPSAASSTRSIR